MPKVPLCQDGLVAELGRDEGYWIELTDPTDRVIGRFVIDESELDALIAGAFAFQATNGEGASVSIEGADGGLKVRLELRGHGTKQCRLDAETVQQAIKTLGGSV